MPKKSKKENKVDLCESILKQIEEETGFHTFDVQYIDGYYVPEERGTICHFKIKEIPGYLFAFWHISLVNTPYPDVDVNSEYIFFCQYIRDIDKFKPSRSAFVQGTYRQEWDEQPNGEPMVHIKKWEMFRLIETLKFMHKHPIKAYYYVSMCIADVWEEVGAFKAFRIYIMDWIYYMKWKLIHKFEYIKYKHIGIKFCKHLHQFSTILEVQGNEYPQFTVHVCRKDDIDIDAFEKEVDIIDAFEEKWSHKIWVREWSLYIDSKTPAKDIKADKQSRKRFKEYWKTHIEEKNDNEHFQIKILYKKL